MSKTSPYVPSYAPATNSARSSRVIQITWPFPVRAVDAYGDSISAVKVEIDLGDTGFPLPHCVVEGADHLTMAQRSYVERACVEPMIQAYVQVAATVQLVTREDPPAKSPSTPRSYPVT